jgi:hypothetical protein
MPSLSSNLYIGNRTSSNPSLFSASFFYASILSSANFLSFTSNYFFASSSTYFLKLDASIFKAFIAF